MEAQILGAIDVLNSVKLRFESGSGGAWPTLLPSSKEAAGAAQAFAQLEAACAQARSDLHAELIRPEVILLVLHYGLEDKYLAVIWAILKCRLWVTGGDGGEAVVESTVHAIPRAFLDFFLALHRKLRSSAGMLRDDQAFD
jgi:hypothetical protein